MQAVDARTTDLVQREFVSRDELARVAGLGSLDARRQEALRRFPMRWPRAYLELANPADPNDPILRMGLPDPRELGCRPGDLPDPVGEAPLAQPPHLVRKHPDRALLLVTARCHFYCRFCFRRSFPDGTHRDPTASELERALEAVAADSALREVILSGGDPLVLEDARLEAIISRLDGIRHVERLRIHTRAPVVLPRRLTPELVRVLASGPPCRLVTHANHPVEVTAATRRVVATLSTQGLPLLNQAVLLRGVNDAVSVLADLHQRLSDAGCAPYYLHHTDRTPGNAHFRVSLDRGRRIYRELRERLPASLLPRYVVDLPDGCGKVLVEDLERTGPESWRYTHPDGRVSALEERAAGGGSGEAPSPETAQGHRSHRTQATAGGGSGEAPSPETAEASHRPSDT